MRETHIQEGRMVGVRLGKVVVVDLKVKPHNLRGLFGGCLLPPNNSYNFAFAKKYD